MARKDAMPTVREHTRPKLVWFVRHAQALARWPVIEEEWAVVVEQRRVAETANRDTAYLHGAGR